MQVEPTQLNSSLSQLPVLPQATESRLPADEDEKSTVVMSPDAIEDLISLRASKRAQKKANTLARAEEYKRAGDVLCESRNYKAAYPQYLEAIQLLGNVPEYYISLAAVYRKLTWHEEAAHAATRALTIDPRNLDARYIRGVARLEQNLLHAAQTDFETVLEHDASHLRALAANAEVKQFLAQSGLQAPAAAEALNAGVDFKFPHWDFEALEVASVSDSSDCQHVGKGVPCRFYNHNGCVLGTACAYSHAPDEKSVRDELGKNVCVYHLLDSCKFGGGKCVYSHSKKALPKRGWWNSGEKVAKVKAVLEVAEKNARERRHFEGQRWKADKKDAAKAPNKAGVNGNMEPKNAEGDKKAGEGNLDQIKNEVRVVPTAKPVIDTANAKAPANETPSAKAKEKRKIGEAGRTRKKTRRQSGKKTNFTSPPRAPSNAIPTIAAQSLVQDSKVGAEPGCTDASDEVPSSASPTMAAVNVAPIS